MTPLLAAHGVSRSFGDRVALHPCELELCAGEAVALVGQNGAGKSTLLSILAGSLDPTEGHVERGTSVGWSPQRPAIYRKLTPRENLELFARLGEVPVPIDGAWPDFPEQPAAQLSVGQRQRLNLAIAFLGSPRVLLLDEPTASLDPERRAELWERVDALRGEGGAICFVTQDSTEVGRADRMGRIEDGRLSLR